MRVLANSMLPSVASPPINPITAFRWNGSGNGIGVIKESSTNDDTEIKFNLDRIRTEPNFKSVNFCVNWRMLESSPGVFDPTYLNWIYNYITNVGGTSPQGLSCPANAFSVKKYFWIEPLFMRFNGDGGFGGTQAIPQDIIDAGWTYVVAGIGNYADMRVPQVVTRYSVFMAALIAWAKARPFVEGVLMTESANQYNPPGFVSCLTSMKATSDDLNIGCLDNFMGDEPYTNPFPQGTIIFNDWCITNKVCTGGPDVKPPSLTSIVIPPHGANTIETWGQLNTRGAGNVTSYSSGPYNFSTIDKRGRVPNILEVEVKEETSAIAYGWAQIMRCTHLFWHPEDSASIPEANWGTTNGIVATVNANPNALAGYPSAY